MTGDRPRAPSGLSYRDAGVDVEAKARMLDALAPVIRTTHSDAVVAGFGAFAGALRLPADAGFLLATTDGVGTKTLLARRLGRDAVIGHDIVAHCANDLVVQGAQPLAFLDYIAMGRLDPAIVGAVVEAMVAACRDFGVALLGGETAEMPDVYIDGAYDVVGTMLGLAPRDGLITGDAIRPGDRLVGLASTGLHTNGYSLARRVVDRHPPERLGDALDARGTTVAEALLSPHCCYAPAILSLLAHVRVDGMAHITGGGLVDNLVRPLPEGCRARLARGWPEPPIFDWLRRAGPISEPEMTAAFNLGIGLIVVVAAGDVARAIEHFSRAGIPAYEVGEIIAGPRGVDLS